MPIKKCKYILNIDGRVIEFESEQQLDVYVRNNNLSSSKLGDYVFSKDIARKHLTLLLDKENISKGRLELDKKAARERYDNLVRDVLHNKSALEEGVDTYTDEIRSVLEHIYRQEYVKPLNVENFRKFRFDQLKQTYGETQLNESLEAMVENEINSWNYINKTGKALDAIASIVFNKNNQIKHFMNNGVFDIEKFKKDYASEYGTYDLEGISEETINSFVNQIVKLNIIQPGDTALTQYVVDTTGSEGGSENPLRGKIDLVVVKADGSIQIYDYKASSRLANDLDRKSEWDKDKIKAAKYQLAFYKRMLNFAGIPTNKISMNIIPFNLEGIDASSKTLSGVKVEQPIQVIPDDYMNETARRDIFINQGQLANETDLYKGVQDDMKKIFPILEFSNSFDIANLDYHKARIKQDSQGFYFTKKDSQGGFPRVYGQTKEELFPALQEYIEELQKSHSENTVPSIRNALSDYLKRFNAGKLDPYEQILFPKLDEEIELNLRKYFTVPGWRVLSGNDVETDVLLDLNTIVLVNDTLGYSQADVLILSSNDISAQINLGRGTTIQGKFNTDKQLEKDPSIMKSTIGNIELMKGMVIANHLSDILGETKIGEIKTMNVWKPQVISSSIGKLRSNFNQLMNKASLTNNLSSDAKFLTSTEYAFTLFKNAIENNKSLPNDLRPKLEAVNKSTPFGIPTINNKIENIKALASIWTEMNEYGKFKKGMKVDDNTFEAYLYRSVGKALAEENDLVLDFFNEDLFSKYGVSSQGFMADFKNRSLLNGTYTNTVDTIPIIKAINEKLQITSSNIRQKFADYKQPSRKHFNKVSGFLNTATLNSSMFSMKDFFDMSDIGKQRFLVKDPERDNTLNNEQKEFLTYWLDTINYWRYAKVNEKGIRQPLVPAFIQEKKMSGEWFEVPLLRGSTYSRALNGEFSKGYLENVMNVEFNRRDEIDLTFDYAKGKSDFRNMMYMYNTFDSNQNNREQFIANTNGNPHGKFETHLEEILDQFVLSKVSKEEYDKVLPPINAAITSMQLTAYMSKVDVSATVEFIDDYLRSSVFNESLIEEGNRSLYKAGALLKSVSSKWILGFNPLSGAKEVMYGFYQNYTRAVANNSLIPDKDKLSLGDITKAYKIVWTDVTKQITTQTLLENLNFIYGMSNFDKSGMVENMNYHKTDFARFNDKMFWMNKAPDFLNRMSILVGYMIKHGCYDAHSVDKDDRLKYDWKKDKRFEAFAKNDKSDPSKYNYQRALYNKMMDELINVERLTIWDDSLKINRLLTKEDELPRAFTNREIRAYKQESDTAFGYMDHDSKSLYLKSGIWTFLHQFQTFLSARKNQYLLKRGTHDQGKYIHMRTAEGQFLYHKTVELADGTIDRIQTTEVTDEPVLDWEGKIMEGIFWSLTDLFNVVKYFKGGEQGRIEFLENWKDPVKLRNLLIALQELLLVVIITGTLALTYGGYQNYKQNINKTDNFAERNLMTVLYRSTGDLNIFDTLSGGVSFEFPGFTWGNSVKDNIITTLKGDQTLAGFLSRNIGATQMFRKELQDYNSDRMSEERRSQGQ